MKTTKFDSALRIFAATVLQEQRAHGDHGDQEYIRMAEAALAESQYQGWTNRETWSAHACITNDERLYTELKGSGAEDLRQTLQAWAINGAAGIGDHGKTAVVLSIGSLWRVNWQELAEALK